MGESGRCVFNEIVAAPLTKENSEAWFEWVKNYLIARDLWEVVDWSSARPLEDEEHEKDFVRWRRKNAVALHAIQISCFLESFLHIKGVSEAKVAWHILNHNYNAPMLESESESEPEPQVPPQVMGDVAILYQAIRDNNWSTAKAFLDRYPSALTAELDAVGQTSLHLAAMFGYEGIVEELLQLIPPQCLEIVNEAGSTPLLCAAHIGVATRIAELMVNRNGNIIGISLPLGDLPVTVAFSRGHKEMGRYLYSVTPLEYLKPENGTQGVALLYWCFVVGALDVALDLLQQCRELLFSVEENGWSPILGFVNLPSVFANDDQLVFWKRWIYKYINVQSTTTTCFVRVDIQQQNESEKSITGFGLLHRLISQTCNILGVKEIHELKLVQAQAAQLLSLLCENMPYSNRYKESIIADALCDAAREGNVEFVVQVSKAYPQLLPYTSRDISWNIFFYAVDYRQAEVFNLIHGVRFKDAITTQLDASGNSMLHVAGQLAPSFQLNRISGPALQMQRELQWFKQVESVVPHGFKVHKNIDGMQPKDIFKENHKELRKEGEKWMKETASSCSVVGALVVTIMFAAAFTVPGGNNQDSGYPIFLDQEKLFMLFVISDALSLFSSTTSVLTFLGILTSRYAEEDFLTSLPKKLIIGLSTLFLSIATMIIAFSSSILLMLQHKYSWSFIPVIMLSSVPVILFVLLQFPLLVQMVSSTYGRGIFNKNVKPWLRKHKHS